MRRGNQDASSSTAAVTSPQVPGGLDRERSSAMARRRPEPMPTTAANARSRYRGGRLCMSHVSSASPHRSRISDSPFSVWTVPTARTAVALESAAEG